MGSTLSFGRVTLALLTAFVASVPGCNGDDDSMGGQAGASTCTSSGGPVEDGAVDMHCTDASGDPIVQSVGACQSDVAEGAAGAAGAGGGAGTSTDEEFVVLTSHQGADDDCKYDVSFTNGCVELNRPVTFTVKLTTRATGKAATGARPYSPEIYLADDPSHISPSFEITAPEKPSGTYAIGPIVFDRAGRWVVRFHFYETCSDVPEDSPHAHIAFYIDVP